MHAKALAGPLAALIALGCGGGEGRPLSLPPELHTCAPYARAANTLSYCVVRQAGNLPSPQDVERVCPLAGALELECRRAWARSRADPRLGFPTEVLVAICAGSEECAFEIIDARPESDLARQLELCARVAGQFAEDCAVHALERWVGSRPGPEEVARVASLRTAAPARVGYALGVVRACQDGPACAGEELARAACEATVDQIRQGERACPHLVAPPGFPRGRP